MALLGAGASNRRQDGCGVACGCLLPHNGAAGLEQLDRALEPCRGQAGRQAVKLSAP